MSCVSLCYEFASHFQYRATTDCLSVWFTPLLAHNYDPIDNYWDLFACCCWSSYRFCFLQGAVSSLSFEWGNPAGLICLKKEDQLEKRSAKVWHWIRLFGGKGLSTGEVTWYSFPNFCPFRWAVLQACFWAPSKECHWVRYPQLPYFSWSISSNSSKPQTSDLHVVCCFQPKFRLPFAELPPYTSYEADSLQTACAHRTPQ